MINQTMVSLGQNRSAIRELFEFGKKRKAEIGAENVFDFSLGNPSVPAPDCVKARIGQLLEGDAVALHGYTSAQGDAETRKALADIEIARGGKADPNLMYMTCGAAAGLTVSLTALLQPGEEVIVFAPYFPEYTVFIHQAGGVVKSVPTLPDSFRLDFTALSAAIGPKTKAIILNSPNNPSGVLVGEDELRRLAALLEEKERQFGTELYLIADEPYRALVYGGKTTPSATAFYRRTIVCYSYSKTLSLPGERIGYLAVHPEMEEAQTVYAAICGAGRSLGFVCAPALMQYVLQTCGNETADLKQYDENRRILSDALRKIGYSFPEPEGAFYLFVKALEDDAAAFSMKARDFELLLVPSDSFGVPGYIRISYCVSKETILASLPAFEKLYRTYHA